MDQAVQGIVLSSPPVCGVPVVRVGRIERSDIGAIAFGVARSASVAATVPPPGAILFMPLWLPPRSARRPGGSFHH